LKKAEKIAASRRGEPRPAHVVEPVRKARARRAWGTISENFHAEGPYLPRGCMAQAWSVAEALRSWALTA
jgi:glycogen debranching enzyme